MLTVARFCVLAYCWSCHAVTMAARTQRCGDIKKEVWLGAQAHRDWAAAVNATNHPMLIEVVAGYLFLLNKTVGNRVLH